VRIYHVATRADWETAQAAGSYTISTYGHDLDEVGFIHAARREQWPLVKRRYYAEIYEPLVLLEIDTARLTSLVVDEQPHPGAETTYPHIYGALNVDAVVGVRDITRPVD